MGVIWSIGKAGSWAQLALARTNRRTEWPSFDDWNLGTPVAVVLKISVKSMSISNSGSVMLGDPALISIYWRYCKSP